MTEKTFVYDGTEVRKTGRKATKQSRTLNGAKTIEIVEITPVDPDLEWKKWVNPDELFAVE